MSTNYPILKYPSILVADNYKNYKVVIPVKPTQPVFQGVIFKKKSFFSTSFWLIIAIALLGQGSEEESVVVPQIILIGVIIVYRVLRAAEEKKNYQKKVSDSKNEHEKKHQEYLRQLDTYNAAIEQSIKLNTILSKEEGESQKFLFLKQVYDYMNIETKKPFYSPRKGFTEIEFLKLLKNRFRHRIIIDKQIGIYYPDFIYFDNVRQIYIDIEIDEPYDLKTGLPIHFYDLDNSRDDFFILMNWIVVRFSEFQVVKFPQECIQTLENIISLFEYGETSWNCMVEKVSKWTEAEAHEMAKNNYREKYLGIPFVTRQIEIKQEMKELELNKFFPNAYGADSLF